MAHVLLELINVHKDAFCPSEFDDIFIGSLLTVSVPTDLYYYASHCFYFFSVLIIRFYNNCV